MPLDPYASGASSDEILRRVQLAARHPNDSFVWWLEARRADRAPRADALRRRHAEIFRIAWPERYRRLPAQVGERRDEEGRHVVAAPRDTTGYLLVGPYMPFAAGHYSVTFPLRRGGTSLAGDTVVAVLDALADGAADPCLARREIRADELPPGRWTNHTLAFDVSDLRWTGQLRVFSPGVDALSADTAIDVDDHDSPVWPPLART
jgi:hypothetical protein